MSRAFRVLGAGPSIRRVRFRVACAALALIGSLFAAPANAADGSFCRDPAINSLVRKAAADDLSVDRLADLSRRFNDSKTLPDCETTVAYCIGLKTALATVDSAAGPLHANPPDLLGARDILERGQRQGSPWQLLALLGQVEIALAHATGNADLYLDAASHLQMALNAMNDPGPCHLFEQVPPDPEQIRLIRKQAQEAVMLSPHFDLARTRAGDCGGIFLDKVRGIEVEAVPVPITFAYDKAQFTPEGQKAADALLACVKEKKLPSLTLTGHTDLHGSDGYNMDLSARRLATVEAYLKGGGYTGAFHLIPKGKSEPFQPDDPTQYGPAETDQMNRRVELREVKP